jgi:hypothetical protein
MTSGQPAAPGRLIRAAVFGGPGQPVRVSEVGPPRAGEVEVAVAEAAAALADLGSGGVLRQLLICAPA